MRTSSARSIRRSTILGLASARRVFFDDTVVGSLSTLPEMMRLRDALSETMELTMQVTRMSRMVPLRTSSLSKPIPCPTNAAARVAAACDVLRPNIRLRSPEERR